MPRAALRVVVLPAPFRPSRATTSPSPTARLRSCTTRIGPYAGDEPFQGEHAHASRPRKASCTCGWLRISSGVPSASTAPRCSDHDALRQLQGGVGVMLGK